MIKKNKTNKIRKYILLFSFFTLTPAIGCLNSFEINAKNIFINPNLDFKDFDFFPKQDIGGGYDLVNNKKILNKIRKGEDFEITLKYKDDVNKNLYGETVNIPFSEYIVGVTAQEIGLDAPIEALKAQMVAAATFAINAFGINKTYVSSTKFQVYIPREKRIKNYGEEREKIAQTLKNEGLTSKIILYNDNIFNPVYCNSMPGTSRENQEIWGKNDKKNHVECYPRVFSPELEFFQKFNTSTEKEKEEFFKKFPDAQIIKKYANSVKIVFKKNINEVFKVIRKTNFKAKVPSNKNEIVKIISKFESGYIDEVEIFGVKFSGEKLKSKLDLSSSFFNTKIEGEDIVFECFGQGHGVGMSQMGAIVFAVEGKKYDEILRHYYSEEKNSSKISFKDLKDLDEKILVKKLFKLL